MEFYYCCTTCDQYRRDALPGTPSLPEQRKWCLYHRKSLPNEESTESLICTNFKPEDSRATEWLSVIAKLPQDELWTFDLYRPSRKFATIADLPKVDPTTGEVIPP